VCRRLDGIPLALEFAARLTRAMPVEAVAERLDDRFRLLAGRRRTALGRQQTLRALIDWSYDLLGSEEQALFARLCVFAGAFTLEAAGAICGESDGQGAGDDVLAPLLRLVDTSFVVSATTVGETMIGGRRDVAVRYRLPKTLREYGRERLIASGEQERLRHRHLAYCLGLVETAGAEVAGSPRVEALSRLEASRDDLWAALAWLRDHPAGDATRRLDQALARLAAQLADPTVRHALAPLLVELRRLGLPAYAALLDGLLEQALPEVLAGGIDLYWIIGDHEAQARILRRRQEVQQEPGAAGRVQLRRARWLLLQRSVREALALLDEIERTAERRGDDPLRLDVLLERGYAHTHTGDCAQGRRAYDEALTLLERLRPRLPDAAYRERRLVAVRGRGFVAHNADDNETCAACHRDAGALAQVLGDRPEMVRARLNLADARWGCGDLSGALRTYRETLEVSDTAYCALVRFGCLMGCGIVLESIGRTEEAAASLREGLGLARDLGDAWWIAYGLAHLSAVLAAQGDLVEALDVSQQAVAVALRHGVGYPLALARTHTLWQQEVLEPGAPEHTASIEGALREAEALGLRGLAVYLSWVRLLHRAADPAVPDADVEEELASGLRLYRERAPLKGTWEVLGCQARDVLLERRPLLSRTGLDTLIDDVVERKAASLAPGERQAYRDSRRRLALRRVAWGGRCPSRPGRARESRPGSGHACVPRWGSLPYGDGRTSSASGRARRSRSSGRLSPRWPCPWPPSLWAPAPRRWAGSRPPGFCRRSCWACSPAPGSTASGGARC
jgi:predicted ATPase